MNSGAMNCDNYCATIEEVLIRSWEKLRLPAGQRLMPQIQGNQEMVRYPRY